jgi:predicted acetyltransferase
VPFELRRLTAADLPAAWEMSRLAFGLGPEPPTGWLNERPGRRGWGLFDGARLVAKVVDREQQHWFGGRLVPASGVAGVVVAPELRRTGLARRLMTGLLASARERGAVISTLFRTTPQLYRALGYEEVGALTWTALPTSSLESLGGTAEVALRAAVPGDVPGIAAAYRSLARESAGLLERSGPLFDGSPDELLAAHDGVTVAIDPDGGVAGYASWERKPGYDADGAVAVPDLVALTAPAARALLGMLGSWSAVAPTLSLRLPPASAVGLLAPLTGARVESWDPWMLRVLDAPGAVAARGWPAGVEGSADLALDDEVCPWNTGSWHLVLEGGAGRLEPGGTGATRLAMRGLAVLYAGAAGPAVLRRAGLLSGGDPGTDAFLEAATAGPPPALLDYF